MQLRGFSPEEISGNMYAGPVLSRCIAPSSSGSGCSPSGISWLAHVRESSGSCKSYGQVRRRYRWLRGSKNFKSGWNAMTDAIWAIRDQAKELADAYESAYRSVVPPKTIATNRAEKRALLAINSIGLFDQDIAELDDLYMQYGGEDEAVMLNYADAG